MRNIKFWGQDFDLVEALEMMIKELETSIGEMPDDHSVHRFRLAPKIKNTGFKTLPDFNADMHESRGVEIPNNFTKREKAKALLIAHILNS